MYQFWGNRGRRIHILNWFEQPTFLACREASFWSPKMRPKIDHRRPLFSKTKAPIPKQMSNMDFSSSVCPEMVLADSKTVIFVIFCSFFGRLSNLGSENQQIFKVIARQKMAHFLPCRPLRSTIFGTLMMSNEFLV